MTHDRKNSLLRNPFASKNWEENIRRVSVEPCDEHEDPLGYHAIFFLSKAARRAGEHKMFVIGASYLAQRKHNLMKAGYKAPMTNKAINLIEGKTGAALPVMLA